MPPFVTQRTVEYSQTDMAGIVHYSEFFRYMESAEHEFFRSVGLSVHPQDDPAAPSWPRVSCRFDYRRPLRFEDTFDIHLSITKLSSKTATFAARLHLNGELVAEGESTSVCCRLTSEGLHSVEIPEAVRTKLQTILEPEETSP